jgi:hypothetical protein
VPQISSVAIIDSVGRAIGRQRREIDAELDAIRAQISPTSTTDRMLNLFERGLNALTEEAKQDGLTASAYLGVSFQ